MVTDLLGVKSDRHKQTISEIENSFYKIAEALSENAHDRYRRQSFGYQFLPNRHVKATREMLKSLKTLKNDLRQNQKELENKNKLIEKQKQFIKETFEHNKINKNDISAKNENSSLKKKIKVYEEKSLIQQKENEKMKNQIFLLKEKITELNDKNKKEMLTAKQKEGNLRELEKSKIIKDLSEKSKKDTEKIISLEKDLNQLKGELGKIEKGFEDKDKIVISLKDKILHLQDQLSKQQSETEKEKKFLLKSKKEAIFNTEKTFGENQILTDNIKKLTEQLSKANFNLQKMEKNVKIFEAKSKILHKKIQKSQSEKNELKIKIDLLSGKVSKMELQRKEILAKKDKLENLCKKGQVQLQGAEIVAQQRLSKLEEYEKEIASCHLKIKSQSKKIDFFSKYKLKGTNKSITKELNEILGEKKNN
ncbi:hypothetical protein MHBO_001489 [Bonamia ostreae]